MAELKSKMPKSSAPPRKAKVFRIALFGRRSAGKTCFLAAINMPRTPHPEGLSCSLKQFEKGDHDAFKRGWTRITEATERITNGGAPRPTPNSDLLAFHLIVGAPRSDSETENHKVEMIDYSGELLDAKDSGELADLLTKHLRESDAMIVLAEYPGSETEVGYIPTELNLLGQAFNRVKDKCPDLPVAFVVNKWDRNSALHDHKRTLEVQSKHLQDFLSTEPLPFHCRLRDIISNATGKRFREFPVSVFGEYRIDESVDEAGKKESREVPEMHDGTLNSFGLDDALFWLVQEIKRARARKRRRNVTAMATALVIVLLLALVWDEYHYRDLAGVIESPSSTDEAIELAEAKLESYGDPANLWHIVLHRYRPAEEIEDLIQQSREQREQNSWDRVKGIQDLKEQALAAQGHLSRFPQGRFSIEANTIIETLRTEERETEIMNLVGSIQADLEAIRQQAGEESLPSIDALESRISEAFKRFSLPSDLSNQVIEIRGELRIRRAEAVAAKKEAVAAKNLAEKEAVAAKNLAEKEAVAAKNLADWKQKFNYLLVEEGEALEAGQHLASLLEEDRAKCDAEIRQYRELALGKLETQLKRDSGEGRGWTGAVDSIDTFVEVIAKPHREWLLPEDTMDQLTRIKDNLETQGDRYLYDFAREEPDSRKIQALKTYLEEAPIKAMQEDCKHMLGYLEALEKEQDLSLVLKSIRWGKKVDASTDNWVEIEIGDRAYDGKGPFQATPGEISLPSKDKSTLSLGKRRINDQINLRIKIKDRGAGFWNRAGVQGATENSVAVVLGSLLEGKIFALQSNKHGTTEVNLRVEGIPERPELAPYHLPR